MRFAVNFNFMSKKEKLYETACDFVKRIIEHPPVTAVDLASFTRGNDEVH